MFWLLLGLILTFKALFELGNLFMRQLFFGPVTLHRLGILCQLVTSYEEFLARIEAVHVSF